MTLQELIDKKVIQLQVRDGVARVKRVNETALDKPRGYMFKYFAMQMPAPSVPNGGYLVDEFEEVNGELKLQWNL